MIEGSVRRRFTAVGDSLARFGRRVCARVAGTVAAPATLAAFVAALTLVAGANLYLVFDRHPSPVTVTGCVALLVVVGRWCRSALAAATGLMLIVAAASAQLADRLDPSLAGIDQEAVVRILDFPVPGTAQRFDAEAIGATLPGRLRLSWYEGPDTLRPGECWKLTLRLRRPRGFSNPVRFDYERWLFVHGIGATGYVRHGERVGDCGAASMPRAARVAAAKRILARLPDDDARAVILAVSLGARQWLDPERWQGFAVTGTSHLMAISGLHVSLAAAAFFLIVRVTLAACAVRSNQRLAATLAAVAVAAAYALTSGFAVPSRRAVLMLAAALPAAVARRPIAPWHSVGLAAIVIAIATPLDVLSAGFRLSFIAVLLLLWMGVTAGGGSPVSRWRPIAAFLALARLQWLLLLGMLPISAWLFGRLTWTAPFVNLLVVPAFNLAALPLALAALVLPGVPGDTLLRLAWQLMDGLLRIIDVAAALPAADWRLPAIRGSGWLALGGAALGAVLPRGCPGRLHSLILLLACAFPERAATPPGCADLTVLDVGQGLAAVVRTADHVLIYDSGPRFRSGGDTGRLVVTPFLDDLGLESIDRLIVSHADLDHAGGAASIVASRPVKSVLAGETALPGLDAPVFPCRAGMRWEWDGVQFALLHPARDGSASGNDASCVLEVTAGSRRLLLTGDIGAAVERQLVASGLLTKSEVVVIPHHGSDTSSSAALVAALSARYAVASAGYANRWSMPRPDVVRRWTRSGATLLTTADDGAVGFRACPDALSLEFRHRRDARRPWTER